MDHLERGPALANAVVVLGFLVLMTVFLTDSVWSIIIGVGTVVAAGLWAGLVDVHPSSDAPLHQTAVTEEPVTEEPVTEEPVTEQPDDEQPDDERDDGHAT